MSANLGPKRVQEATLLERCRTECTYTEEELERPVGDLDLQAIMIDGIEYHEYLLVVALGFTSTTVGEIQNLDQ